MKKLGITLSSKVLLIFVGALVLLGALAWGFSKPWRGPWRDQLPKVVWINLRAHLLSVAEKLGSPPNEEKARTLLSELRLELVVRENDRQLFATTQDLPAWSGIEDEIRDEEKIRASRPGSIRSKLGDFIVGRSGGRMFAALDFENRRYVFFPPDREGLQAGLRAFSGFAFTIAFLLLIVFGVTRWLLRPLTPLMQGVGELAKGNLDYRVSIQPRGEFRRVADAFNGMAEKLQRQLKSKDQLLMDVSHELRSPLGRIKMAAEMLPHAEGSQGSLRSQIQTDVREMEDLVSELLELYRLGEASQQERKTVELNDVVRGVLAPLAAQRPGVEYNLEKASATLLGDAKQLKRAIRNLVENAIKFSRHQDRPVEVSLRLSEGVYIIEVRDYGVGMTEEQCGRIFEPFYRVDSSRVRETGGFGLGLPLAQAIIAAHGGSIACEAKLDHGCVFRVRLPADKQS